MRISMVGVLAGILLALGSPVSAQISIIQGSDGSSGTVTDLGNGFWVYSDSHGNTGTILDLGGGLQSYQFSSPEGRGQSGTILNLGSPADSTPSRPPQNSTSPYSLPSKPYGPLVTPSQPSAPTAPMTPGASFGSPVGGTWGSVGSR
ncbi:MAG: hypothetical protein ACREIS_13405 [Nitrospiraceae bacterium]